MVVWKVDDPTATTFRAIFQGAFIKRAFRDDWVGKQMADVIPEPLRVPAVAAARHCSTTGKAIFMNYAAPTQSGGTINCERLILPFGTPTGTVQQLVTSMEPISFDDNVNLDRALDEFLASFTITYAGDFAA